MPFADRADAGRQLACRLTHLRGSDVIVLALPRGGVPVAVPVARALAAPLDVIVVRKLGVPRRPELAMGAVGEGRAVVRNDPVLLALRVAATDFALVEQAEREELARRTAVVRAVRAREPLAGRTAVIVDDGIATGSTARAACAVARAQGAGRVVLAVPVCSADAAEGLTAAVDELVTVETPAWFGWVGQHYADFRPTSEEDVLALLRAGQSAG
ncbi:Predicted phosphoribosyltransferase [Modestobacter sp. DSM 44400]|uniref:phosphoribosyltransferase n=1 Tax=Modestobacter sp. DSM 44400 TaxID=1550230 RepID=UPI0008992CEC|nr:phosphoribosyltransferase family protein [Modestobacter sp. DSM 44400]SDY52355.1 Predicted phosphoribosyltransferase [Modestobacter sp. DSM 44400]